LYNVMPLPFPERSENVESPGDASLISHRPRVFASLVMKFSRLGVKSLVYLTVLLTLKCCSPNAEYLSEQV
jgi:hypothetical protein